MPKTERSMLARQARGALAATLLCSALLATGASPAQAQAQTQAQPAAAQPTGQAGQAAKSKPKPVDKAKSTGSAPGDDCSATAGKKVPSWPKKCPGKAKVPAKQ